MNARQKAKRFKRMYEGLLKQPQPIVFAEPHYIDILRVEQCYSEEDFIALNCAPDATSYIQMDIIRGLVASLDKYIVYRTVYDPEMNVYRVCGELKVVDR